MTTWSVAIGWCSVSCAWPLVAGQLAGDDENLSVPDLSAAALVVAQAVSSKRVI